MRTRPLRGAHRGRQSALGARARRLAAPLPLAMAAAGDAGGSPHASADGITPCPGTLGETPEHDRVSLESYGRGDRFARAEVDAQRAKGSSTGVLRCATEDISAPGDLKALKASHLDGCLQLCFQQSPGNSPRPEINMLSGRRGNRLLDQDVADLQAATRLEHPIHLAKYG